MQDTLFNDIEFTEEFATWAQHLIEQKLLIIPDVEQIRESKPKEYEAYQRFQVTTDEVDHVGELLQAAVKAGAYVDGSVSFYVEDTNALYHQALTAAVQNARVTANQTAQALGVTVSGIHSVVVEPSYQSYTVYGNSAMATAEESVADGAAAPEISYDDVEVDASVQILFQY